MLNLASAPAWLLAAVFLGGAAVVWFAGTRLADLVDHFAERTGMGQGLAGLLLLGGITSLPEVATVSTSSVTGSPALAVNNLLGSAAINVVLLAIGDWRYGRGALTSMAAKPITLMQGVLGIILLAAVALIITSGDVQVPGLNIGAGSLLLAFAAVQAMRVSARFERQHVWDAVEDEAEEAEAPDRPERSKARLILLIALCGVAILLGGTALSLSGDAIAERSGLGDSLVGFVLVGFSTSLPELSAIFAALKLRRYELAIGDVFGTNLVNVLLILLADLLSGGEPVLSQVGAFEVAGAVLGVVVTGIMLVGLLERRDRTIGRMGHDSALALIAFAGGLFALSRLG